ERLPWSKGYNILPVQSDEIVCLKMITPQTFGMIPVFQDHLFYYSCKFLFIDCREVVEKRSFAVI
ncbi:hypothetical protein, partial [Sphingobacterium siyangense]